MLGMCYILCTSSSVSALALGAQGFGGSAPEFFFRADIFPGPRDIRWFFGTWFFADGFLFPVKELGFWTNPGHWVRVLDATGSYMYIVL
jgi:hypothetical protein